MQGPSAQTPVMVGSPTTQAAAIKPAGQKVIPFRLATVPRTDYPIFQIGPMAISANTQNFYNRVLGEGYMNKILLGVNATVPSNNSAAVAYFEDAPYNVLGQIVLHDTNGDVINLSSGYHARLLELYSGYLQFQSEGSGDINVWQKVASTGATGGNFQFWLPLPAALNNRDLIGLLGNQDQAQAYDVRLIFNPSTNVYTTAPTALPNLTLKALYQSNTVPNQYNADGSQNQVIPNTYGVIHHWTEAQSENAPTSGSRVTHRLQRKGNTIRSIVLVFRGNAGSTNPQVRAAMESNMPTSIQLRIGSQTVFNEDVSTRRRIMFERTGIDAPAGVLAYDWQSDAIGRLGMEFGHDYIWSQDVTDIFFDCTYPTFVASGGITPANGNTSLTFLTDDVETNGKDIYNP